MTLVVIEVGIATTIQDGGRPGLAHLGISPSGAVDPELAGRVNRLVGNRIDAALIETAGNLVVEASSPATVATSRHAAPVSMRKGARLSVESGGGRQWHYLAVRGGLATASVLGSRSHDTLSGLGAVPLVAGTRLAVGGEADDPVADLAPIDPPGSVARLGPGPRLDWFVGDVLHTLTAAPMLVTATSRVGVRLRGVPLVRRDATELPSEGLVRGAIQVPPDGDPIMMLADHPTTGGYPVVAVVHPDDVAIVAQRPAGTRVQFRL